MSRADAMTILTREAQKVGFERLPIPSIAGAPRLTESSSLWVASYALLLVCEAESTEVAVRKAAKAGQEWLDLACIQQEMKAGTVVDGYLLVLLTSAPDEATEALIQTIELDPSTCRKHFAWSNEASDADLQWSRIYRVTVIGLPASPEAARITGSPMLGPELQKRLLTDIKDLGAQEAARQHARDPQLGPDA